MLVLTRKKNQSIKIGKDIEIKVLGIEDGKVKLGISAPKSIEVHRKEIYERIADENRNAINSNMQINSLNELVKKMK
ncbi:MAG: carbon storage regulator CsrA [Maledivibacter sp.]|jgi:carbon storage regulator|nr:carbon storage regulator CsrA [Maledivibacter sp.]